MKERETGLEPAAPTLARWCSTTEPLAHYLLKDIFNGTYIIIILLQGQALFSTFLYVKNFQKFQENRLRIFSNDI